MKLEINLNFTNSNDIAKEEIIIEPTLKYEQLRRRIKSNIQEFFNFMKFEGNHIAHTFENQINAFMSMAYDMKK